MSTVEELATHLLRVCEARDIMLATAESCTGGLVTAALTAIPGSSRVVDRGFVTYSNEAKMEMLGVRPATLEAYGAVSAETASVLFPEQVRETIRRMAVEKALKLAIVHVEQLVRVRL